MDFELMNLATGKIFHKTILPVAKALGFLHKLIRRKGNDSGRCMVLYEDGSLSKGWRKSRSSEPLEMSLS